MLSVKKLITLGTLFTLLACSGCGKKRASPPAATGPETTTRSHAKQQGIIQRKPMKRHTSGRGKARKKQERALKYQRKIKQKTLAGTNR